MTQDTKQTEQTADQEQSPCSDVACDTCRRPMRSDRNSFWCDDCQLMWPRSYIELVVNEGCDECGGEGGFRGQTMLGWDHEVCEKCGGDGERFKSVPKAE